VTCTKLTVVVYCLFVCSILYLTLISILNKNRYSPFETGWKVFRIISNAREELLQDLRTARARNIFLVVNKNDADDDNYARQN